MLHAREFTRVRLTFTSGQYKLVELVCAPVYVDLVVAIILTYFTLGLLGGLQLNCKVNTGTALE